MQTQPSDTHIDRGILQAHFVELAPVQEALEQNTGSKPSLLVLVGIMSEYPMQRDEAKDVQDAEALKGRHSVGRSRGRSKRSDALSYQFLNGLKNLEFIGAGTEPFGRSVNEARHDLLRSLGP
ncbi:hypothetical protein H113_04047 [Trichophyton rubrum MR1459]|uniref:Uncharacterized protein n=1 Tax=Trichophyton rubrum (strain ATCC MYA-4607 / CBS 118892) TaxID=559305 RepID=A0A080WUY1_TRIRC|nr:uncharacterized protein TERG_12268 [Trichophyton rubrum CBS 118892]EZF95600.1 hypothetical protein H113_04047 [Trichophyton rubrum MR1459]EZG06695.1 hypothetical protein H106_03833 [Trichophyton rubrum CBS 735.88]KFL61923.1 hypothetical protein TERG_12268 [Trichophyton rubrum CBS 118892]